MKTSNSYPVCFEFLLCAPCRPFAAACKFFGLDPASWQEVFDQHSGKGVVACFCLNFAAGVVFGTLVCINMTLTRLLFKVNSLFDTNENDVLRSCHGISTVLNCMQFRVGGAIVVTFRVVSAIVTLVVSLSAWLNQ